MSDTPEPLPQAAEPGAETDGYMAALRLSGVLIACFAGVLVLLLAGDPLLLLASIGYVAIAFAVVVVSFAAAFKISALRKSGQRQAVPGFVTVTATVWVILIALCCWAQYVFMTTSFTLRLP
jgi:hypothetical protein